LIIRDAPDDVKVAYLRFSFPPDSQAGKWLQLPHVTKKDYGLLLDAFESTFLTSDTGDRKMSRSYEQLSKDSLMGSDVGLTMRGNQNKHLAWAEEQRSL
jgi:hypothetical protein